MIFCRHYAVSSDLAQERQMTLPTVPNPCFAQRFSLLDSLIGSDVASDAYGTTFVSAIWISCLLKTNPCTSCHISAKEHVSAINWLTQVHSVLKGADALTAACKRLWEVEVLPDLVVPLLA